MQPASRNREPESRTLPPLLDRCLVGGDQSAGSNDRRRRRKALGISFALETAALALLIIAPLLTTVAQPNFPKTAFVPFIFNPAHPLHAVDHAPNVTQVRPHSLSKGLTFPLGIGLQKPIPAQEEGIAIPGGDLLMATVGPDALPVVGPQKVSPLEPPRDESKKSVEKGLLRLSESVMEATLISRIEPRYPALALQTRLQGTVHLHAIIGRDGRISALEVLSGNPLLVQAALDAVRQWRYRPTLLNGEPVEVETSITVNFRIQP